MVMQRDMIPHLRCAAQHVHLRPRTSCHQPGRCSPSWPPTGSSRSTAAAATYGTSGPSIPKGKITVGVSVLFGYHFFLLPRNVTTRVQFWLPALFCALPGRWTQPISLCAVSAPYCRSPTAGAVAWRAVLCILTTWVAVGWCCVSNA